MEVGVGWGEPQANPNIGVSVRIALLGFAFGSPQPTPGVVYSPIVSSDALPPAAVVLMVSVRSPAKRNR